MKKNFLKAAALCLMLMCGGTANAQLNLGNVLGSVLGGSSSSSSSSSSTSDLISGLTSIFTGSKQAKANNIVGTWTYEEPAIVLSSDNVLTNLAAKAASSKLESTLQKQLAKYGIKKGTLTMTFNEDGSFTSKIGSKKASSGTWKVEDSKLQLTFLQMKTIEITTQLSSNQLMLVTDASKLLTLFKGLASASGNSTLSTVSSLMKKVDGCQAGITLVKN